MTRNSILTKSEKAMYEIVSQMNNVSFDLVFYKAFIYIFSDQGLGQYNNCLSVL